MAAALTVRTDLGQALAKVRGGSPATTKAYRAAVADFTAWCQQQGQAPNVDSAGAYVDAVKARRKSPAYLNTRISALRLAFRQAAQRTRATPREVAILNAALGAWKAARPPEPEVRTVSPQERQQLLEALPDRMRWMTAFLYTTAARVSEAVGVTHQDCAVDGQAVRVLLHGKGGKSRTVRIPAALFAGIVKAFGPGDADAPLFKTLGGQAFTRQYINRELGRASLRVLGRRVGPHQLRHSRASDLMQNTRKAKGIQGLLGHASPSTTLRYYVRETLTDTELFQ